MIAELLPQLHFFLTNMITIFIWLKLMLIGVSMTSTFAADIYAKGGATETYCSRAVCPSVCLLQAFLVAR